jgi:hypothetical protein
MKVVLMVLIFSAMLISTVSLAQSNGKHYRHKPIPPATSISKYNIDSLLQVFAKNTFLKNTLRKADGIYKAARIRKRNISRNAFRFGYLEKVFLDAQAPDSSIEPPPETALLAVVDFTKKGNVERLLVIDLNRKKVLHKSLVSHGSGKGKNKKEGVPLFFSNQDSSNCSSLGMLVAGAEAYPENICHVCKYFLSKPHKCGRLLEGIEAGINDNAMLREIILYTTGSKDYSDSTSRSLITRTIQVNDIDSGYHNDGCYCFRSALDSTSAYTANCGLKEGNNFIGRSQGCLALPEESHINILATLHEGTFIFIYSDSIAEGSTNYFETSPLINVLLHFEDQNKLNTATSGKH